MLIHCFVGNYMKDAYDTSNNSFDFLVSPSPLSHMVCTHPTPLFALSILFLTETTQAQFVTPDKMNWF